MNSLHVSAATHRFRPVVTRLSWATIDQVIWSASNLVAMLLAARALTAKQFGAYSLGILVYTLALGVFRAVSLEALLLRSGDSSSDQTHRLGAAGGSAILIGTGSFMVLAAGSLAVNGAPGTCLLAVGVCLPGLLHQDAWRFGSFAVGRGRDAANSDALWLLLAVLALTGLHLSGVSSPAAYILAWGGAGSLAGMLPFATRRYSPEPSQGIQWLRSNIDLGGRYLLDYSCAAGASQGTFLFLTLVAGVTSLGSLRAAQTLFGPLSVLFTGAYVTLVPEGRRALGKSTKAVMIVAAISSAVFLLIALTLTAALLLIPTSIGVQLLGNSWRGAEPLILPLGLAAVASGAHVGPSALLRSIGDAQSVLRVRLLGLPVVIGLPCFGAALGGAKGASYGLAIATWATALLYWTTFPRSLAKLRSDSPPSLHGEALPGKLTPSPVLPSTEASRL